MNIKLETQRGEAVHAAQVAFKADPPEIMLWNGRVFRLLRTDGVWDRKKHVYREAEVHDLGYPPPDAHKDAPADAASVNGKKPKTDRRVNAVLSPAQAALLKRVRARGAYASPKAALLAGLEALDKKHTLSNDALLKLLAERLGDARRQ